MSINANDLNLEAEGASRFRKLKGIPRQLQLFFGIATPLSGLAFVLDVPFHLTQVTLYSQQFLGLFLGLILSYIYLSLPARPKYVSQKIPWYDWILLSISLFGGLYVAFNYEQLLLSIGIVKLSTVLIGGVMILAILEATRRLTGWPLIIIVLIFALYGRYGSLLPGFLATKSVTWPRLINQLFLGTEFVFGIALQTAGAIVLAFVLFGQFLFGTGGANFLLDLARSTLGKYRGGPAKVAIVASALFGTLSGSAVGNVAAVGVVTIPLMKKVGYKPYFAAAVEAVSSTGGTIMPPVMGAAAFIMAQLLGLPYSEVVLVAVMPAILYYLGLFIQVDMRAAREGFKGIPKNELPSITKTLINGWVYIIPIIILVYGLFGMGLRAELSAMYSLGSLIVIAAIVPKTRNFWRKIPKILEDTTIGLLEVAVVCATAGLVIGIVSYTGLGLSFSRILTTIGGGSLLVLMLSTAIASVILGMGMPVTATYLFLSVLAAPALVKFGVPPILAHMFVFYFGAYSFLTPPVCLAVYAAVSIAQAPMLKTAWQAMKLASAGYIIPFIFIYKPATVFMGSPLEVVLAIFDAVLAVFALALAAEGYFERRLISIERLAFLIVSLVLFVPGWTSRLIGLFLFAILIGYMYFSKNKEATFKKSLAG